MSTLPPLPRPEQLAKLPRFLSVNADERATFDLTAKASFNVLCQDCKSMLPTTFKLLASDTLRQIDQDFPRERKVHQLCKSAADGCHLCTLLLIKIPNIIAGPSDYNRWKDETLVSMEVQPIAHNFTFPQDEHELIFTHKGVQETHRRLTLKTEPYTASEPQKLPCRSIFTGSDECIERCRLWLQQCVESHGDCRRRTPLNPPTRLVEILGPENVRLVEPTTSMPYFTLSYCWGSGANVLSTTTTSIIQFQTAIPFEALPLTIRDAIGVAYKLGARHIWIDSLCILQDDVQDWEREAKEMCHVYRNSTLNIAALGATDATEGLFSRRDPLINAGCRLPHSQHAEACFEHPSPIQEYWWEDFHESALQFRGWAFQERALSSRILHFGPRLFWECGSSLKQEHEVAVLTPSEDFSFNPSIQPRSQDFDMVSLGVWTRMVEQFTERDLTIATDRLPAISGLISHFERRLAWTNLSGLWKEHLGRQLLWCVSTTSIRSDRLDNNAPTWSWISVKSGVQFLTRYFAETLKLFAKIQFDELNLSVVNVHGPLLSLSPWFNLPIISPKTVTPRAVSVVWDTGETDFESLFFAPFLWTTFPEGVCLEGLCVVPDHTEPSTYRRCGYIRVWIEAQDFDDFTPYLERKDEFRIV
jgi:hypothetical protein